MKVVRTLLKIASALFGVAILGIIWFWFFGPDLCGNEVISESQSPGGAKRIVVFQRDCGATTGFSTQASLLPSDTVLPNKPGNVFRADTDHGAAPAGPGGGPNLTVVWEDPRSVVLTYHPKARVFKAERELGGTHVRYVMVP